MATITREGHSVDFNAMKAESEMSNLRCCVFEIRDQIRELERHVLDPNISVGRFNSQMEKKLADFTSHIDAGFAEIERNARQRGVG
jgi:hypothetical protein